MAVIKIFNPTTETWEVVGVGARGPEGKQGPKGENGLDADLTEVQTMIDTALGDIESALSQVVGGA